MMNALLLQHTCKYRPNRNCTDPALRVLPRALDITDNHRTHNSES